MIAAIDNTILTILLNKKASPRPNPSTGKPAEHCKERIEALIDGLSAKNGTLLVPAPALAEALSGTEAAEAYIETLKSFAAIEIASFDGKAAYEFGKMIREAKIKGDKRSGQSGDWAYVKMDRAIVAIALSRKVDVFYSDDGPQISFARTVGLVVQSTWDLDLLPEYAQTSFESIEGTEWPKQTKPPKTNGLDRPPAS